MVAMAAYAAGSLADLAAVGTNLVEAVAQPVFQLR
jgi:hypothetical protein